MTATLLPNGKQQFFNGNGVPLAGGSVYFYIPSTSTLKNTWQNPGQTILNTNPIILDASGEAIIYGVGEYRQVVYDALGNLIWDQLTADITSTLQAGGIIYCGTSTGTANAQILSPTPAVTSITVGQLLGFIAGFTNLVAPTTIEVSALPAATLYYGGTQAGGGLVQAGVYTLIEWDGVHFQLVNPPVSIYGANTIVANNTNTPGFAVGVALGLENLIGRGPSGNIVPISLDETLTINNSDQLGVLAAPGAFNRETIYTTAGTFTWTPGIGTTSVEVYVWGAGSGGGHTAGNGGSSTFITISATGGTAPASNAGVPGVGMGGSINGVGGVGTSSQQDAFGAGGGSGAFGGGGGGYGPTSNTAAPGGFPGGGGGYFGTNYYSGAGGGYSYIRLTGASIPTSVSVVVGAGGAAGGSGAAGGDGMIIVREFY